MSALRRTLTISTLDGTAFAVMVGVGETYLAAFVLAANLGEVAAGLVMTVPLLAGAVLQLLAPAGIRLLGNLRRWVSAMAALQALAFLPLAAMAVTGRISAWAIFASSMLYWGAGMACGAAWTTWAAGIVPSRVRARYFGTRARLCQLGVLAGLVAGGLSLEWGRRSTPGHTAPLWLFGALFGAACGFRLISAALLSRYHDPGDHALEHKIVGLGDVVRRARHGRDIRFLGYMIFVTATAQIAQPFFTPFMLGRLEFSYTQFLTLLGASFVAKSITQPIFGRLAPRIGVYRLLWIGGLGIVPLSALWLISSNFWYLLAMQLFSGAVWGAYELATLLLMFDSIRDDERTSILGKFNVANAFAIVAGSLLGGAVLARGSDSGEAYAAVFILSLIARLASVLFLMRTDRRVEHPAPISVEVEAIRPSAGSITAPIMATIPEPSKQP